MIEDRKENKEISYSEITGSVYIFELNKKYDIDGAFRYNKARFMNHSCDPNCEVEIEKNEIWISSIKDIKLVKNCHMIMDMSLTQTILEIMYVNVDLKSV